MVSESWYQVVTGVSLEQGDLLPGVPIYRVEHLGNDAEEVEVVQETHDVIILTQTCDLENEKVTEVLVAVTSAYVDLVAREGARNPSIRGKDFRRAAIRGNLPPYSLLQAREGVPELKWTIVDFHHVYSVPKVLLEGFAKRLGQRLRLVPPYKEHLAQAFARYMMRVGLPFQLDDFENAETRKN